MVFSPPLIIGEVLFDHFPDGKRVLGGAPFNVAWNLQGLGCSPLFVSAVGDDEEGREIRRRMKEWGMSDRALQTANAPTGKVQVAFRAGQPSFEILDQQAYDQIATPEFSVTPEDYSLLYVGSLAYRHERSRATIQQLIAGSELPRFVDINIRPPWFQREWLPELIAGARWIKMNDDELAQLTESRSDGPDSILAASRLLKEEFGGQEQTHYITSGSSGAYVVDADNQVLFAPAPEPNPLVDTVGAGDAFAAATIAGILKRRAVEESRATAVSFASRTCTIPGATTDSTSHYDISP